MPDIRRAAAEAGGIVPPALLGSHDPKSLVAFGASPSRTAADLLTDAGRIARALPPASAGSQVLLVFERDRYAMAVAFLAALDRGHAVALPSTTRHDAVQAVERRPETVAILHDTDAGFDIQVNALLDEAGPARPLDAPIVLREDAAVLLYSSGTTGPAKAWRKTPSELVGEASSLGRRFRVEAGDRIVGTVPPGHIYGLLFTVLLPLLRGAAFSRETPHHAEAVAHLLASQEANLLVTVPAQLRALAALAPGRLSRLERVFSSTGPLPGDVARSFFERHALPISEIFGSTETGGIASRERTAAEAPPWHPFEEVEVSVSDEGRLCIESPFLHADLPRPFETGDLVRLDPEGGFVHEGRVDGIVKVGGRRVSLAEVETCLRQQTGVEDAAVLAVPAEGARGHQLLAAVVPASADMSALKEALRKRFEPTCVPRRFLGVDALPKEGHGKTQREQLLRLFGLQADGRPFSWKLDWGEVALRREEEVRHWTVSVGIPEDYGWFDGHFDGYAVLAGAVQLKELILPTIARCCPELGAVESMPRIKFAGRLVPGDRVTVCLSRTDGRSRVQVEIRRSETVCTHGTLVFSSGSDGGGERKSEEEDA